MAASRHSSTPVRLLLLGSTALAGFAWSTHTTVVAEAPPSVQEPIVQSENDSPPSEVTVEPLVPPIPVGPPSPRLRDAGTDVSSRSAANDAEASTMAWQWLLPGTPLRAAPRHEETPASELSSLSLLPVLERRGEWAQVRYRGERLWLDQSWRPELGQAGSTAGSGRADLGTEAALRQRGRKILGERRRAAASELGPYGLLTDVEDDELLSFLGEATRLVEDAYSARYARRPPGKTRETILLFTREPDYRTYQAAGAWAESSGWTSGHAEGGVAALFVADRSRDGLARTLVHEITHLLNGRCLATSLPAWLEEGLAGDLGALWIEAARTGSSATAPATTDFATGGADLSILLLDELRESGRLVSPNVLMNLDRKTFYRDGPRQLAYDQSAMLVRFLVDGEQGRHARSFQAFLDDVARGRSPDAQRLYEHLALGPEDLDTRFRRWIETEATRIRSSI